MDAIDVMDIINLSLAVGLPWFVGVVWLRYQWREAPEGAWAMVLGLWICGGHSFHHSHYARARSVRASARLPPHRFDSVGFAVLGLQLTRDIPWRGWAGGWTTSAWSAQEPWKKGVFIFLMMVLGAGHRPGTRAHLESSLCLDAWATWAPKARVWYELRHLIPFVDWAPG